MKNLRIFLPVIVLFLVIFSCRNKEKKTAEDQQEPNQQEAQSQKTGWEDIMPSVVAIDSYDGDRILESGQGFFVGEDLVATKYSLVRRANNIRVSPLGSDENYTSDKFVAVDRINDLVILKMDNLQRKPVQLFTGDVQKSSKTLYLSVSPGETLQLFSGKFLGESTVKGTKRHKISNRIRKSTFGAPVFLSDKTAIGIAFSEVVSYETQSFVIPSAYISRLLEKENNEPQALESLHSFTNEKTAAENRKIKGLVLETDRGDITIRLFNETPEYRDNFIRLVKENYYDSLLFHRVISNFGIQSGAADTRYAEKGDLVGSKGPGYTLPAHIEPELFHKRGMIGSPRKPDTKNRRRRSDGSQFYIVSGRRYFDKELDEIAEENDYTFSPEQREVYKTVGGAPHLDGSYTVFGEVTDGMDVVDEIVGVETNKQWRPLEDIRINKVTILN